MLLKKLILAFILGLILFLAWGHPANATTIVRPPVRPLIVNPNITGGALAPTTRAPLVPAPVPGAGAYPVPFYSPLGQIEHPDNPLTCTVEVLGMRNLRKDSAEYRYAQYDMYDFETIRSHHISGRIPSTYKAASYISAYRQLSNRFSSFESVLWSLSPGDVYHWEYKENNFTTWNGLTFFVSARATLYKNGKYWSYTESLFPFELVPQSVPVGADCQPEEEEEECSTSFDCLTKILSGKFPFDIFAAVPDDRSSTCPTFAFFGKIFNLCWLYELVSFARYPIVLSLVIKTVLHL